MRIRVISDQKREGDRSSLKREARVKHGTCGSRRVKRSRQVRGRQAGGQAASRADICRACEPVEATAAGQSELMSWMALHCAAAA